MFFPTCDISPTVHGQFLYIDPMYGIFRKSAMSAKTALAFNILNLHHFRPVFYELFTCT